jgi:hypothetical protein
MCVYIYTYVYITFPVYSTFPHIYTLPLPALPDDVLCAVNRTTQVIRGQSPPWLLLLHVLSKPSMVRTPSDYSTYLYPH